MISEFKNTLTTLNQNQKRNLFLISGVMFLLLFSYPLVRSTTDAIFLENYGAYKSPFVWLYSVVAISFFIWLYDFWQKKWSVKKIHFVTGLFTFLAIIACNLFINQGFNFFSYILYIWKEAYIVLLIHLTLAFLNNTIDLKVAKVLYGPLGAAGSIGGILGGLATSKLVHLIGVDYVLLLGATVIFIASLSFLFVSESNRLNTGYKDSDLLENLAKKKSVLKSIVDVKEYVFAIALIVMMSQFSMSLLNYKLNIWLVEEIHSKQSQTEYFGFLYSLVNGISLVLQILVIPFLFKYVKLSRTHYLIPISYLVVFWGGIFFVTGQLLPVAIAFVYFKGCDYSLFNAAKELLYFNLSSEQKYGAKYIVDMLIYRVSKGLISVGLIFVNTVKVVDLLLTSVLSLWFILLIVLFKKNKELKAHRRER